MAGKIISSSVVNISGAGIASKLSITTQPSTAATSGTAFAQQPVVRVLDSLGNPVLTSGRTVTVARTTGSDTLSGVLSATTNASGIATFSGLTLSGSGGTDALTFSSTGLTDAISSSITVAAAAGTSEPVYTPGVSTLIHAGLSSDASYNSLHVPGTLNYARLAPNVADSLHAITTGKGGIGKAAQLHYPPNPSSNESDQWTPDWSLINGPAIAAGKQHFVRMTMKFDGSMVSEFAVKFFRYITSYAGGGGGMPQWATHNHLPWNGAGYDPNRTYWQACDNGYTDEITGFDQATQPFGPYLASLVGDGLWHRFTFMYKASSSAGATDGIMRMWIDGVRILDNSLSAYNEGIPSGGQKKWTSIPMLQHMSAGVSVPAGGGAFFGGTCSSIQSSNDITISYNIGDGDATNGDTFACWTN